MNKLVTKRLPWSVLRQANRCVPINKSVGRVAANLTECLGQMLIENNGCSRKSLSNVGIMAAYPLVGAFQ